VWAKKELLCGAQYINTMTRTTKWIKITPEPEESMKEGLQCITNHYLFKVDCLKVVSSGFVHALQEVV